MCKISAHIPEIYKLLEYLIFAILTLYIAYGIIHIAELCPVLWASMDCSTPGFPVFHYL